MELRGHKQATAHSHEHIEQKFESFKRIIFATKKIEFVLCVFRIHGLEIVFNAIRWNLQSYRLKPGRLKGSHPMILTNPSVPVIAP